MARGVNKEEGVGPGRPEFEPTADQRKRVERYVATGMKQPEIAAAIGCSVPTLTKHFGDELTNGPARKHAEVIDLMFESAAKGNASIQKRLEEIIARVAAQVAFEGDLPDEKPADAPLPARAAGKKEQANADALTAGLNTEWNNDLAVPAAKLN